MYASQLLVLLASSALVAAHGKVSVLMGNLGGNGTALGIQGGIIPGEGDNTETQQDTTVFLKYTFLSDGLGYTDIGGYNSLSDVSASMALSGNTLPQVSSTGGSISGTWHIVTADGAGPIDAVLDPTGTGKFSTGIRLPVTMQVPGDEGYYPGYKPKPVGRSVALWERAAVTLGLAKRAKTINMDFPIKFTVPDGTACTGMVNGMANVCLVKIANSATAGPFGGVVAVQIVGGGMARRRVTEFRA